jgi:H+-transporting ATPase
LIVAPKQSAADHSIELLKEKMALFARVRRDGAWGRIPVRELVPGDIVRVRLGDIVPADLRLMDGDYLLVDESALTGESLPLEKTLGQEAYAGAIIRQGEMDGVVVATGLNSFFGKTARLVETARTASQTISLSSPSPMTMPFPVTSRKSGRCGRS